MRSQRNPVRFTIDILGSVAWKDRARCAFIARAVGGHYELHLVKANYAPKGSWAYAATATGALALVDLQAESHAEHAEFDAKVLARVPAHPSHTFATPLAKLVVRGKGGPQTAKIGEALVRLLGGWESHRQREGRSVVDA